MKHLACIMDGNRRWAKKHGWVPWRGHRQGAETVKLVADFCIKNNISYLSLYAFSIENLNRPQVERDFLFNMIFNEAEKSLPEFQQKGIRIRFIGDRSLFPDHVIPVCERVEKETEHCTNLNLNILFCYGARQEIVGGIKAIIRKVQAGQLSEDDITDDTFSQYLWTAGMPEPDLVLRTGGHQRLSNFLLYQSAYSEFYFLDCLWPDLTEGDLHKAVSGFSGSQRNFGS